MSNKMSNYSKMAPYYNKITNIISKNGNIRSQRYFLKYLKDDITVLNVGCGSVQFNIDLSKTCKNVTSIDISKEMIEAAKDNLSLVGVNPPNFICEDILHYKPDYQFDVVFANFVLNTFQWETCCFVIKHIDSLVKPGGLLCIADEHVAISKKAKFSQKLFRPIIYLIHHIWANHPMHAIYSYETELYKLGYTIVDKKVDPSEFIASTVYKKLEN